MADVKWIKIVTDIFDDEKILLIETLPEADSIIVIWFKLLCLAGKQNNSGVFMMSNSIPYTEKMLATIFRRKESTVQLALHTFEQFGMIKIINDAITIPNWGKHQTMDKLEAKSAYMREYMQEYRSKQKQLAECKTNGKTNSKANVSSADKITDKTREDTDKNTTIAEASSAEQRFETFWKAYPKKTGKAAALRSWKKIKVNEELYQKILSAIEQAKSSDQWKRDNGQFIPFPATWLNQGRWDDEYGGTQEPAQKLSGKYGTYL